MNIFPGIIKRDVFQAVAAGKIRVRGMKEEGGMASQDRSCKYIRSLTEGPSLTSGCGMVCCPWTVYACKERRALRRV